MKTPKPDISGYTDGFGDAFNAILGFIYGVSLLSLLGIGGFYVQSFELSNAVWTSGTGLAVTWASVFALVTLIASYGINDRDLKDFTDGQSYLTYATGGGIALLTLAPSFTNTIASYQAAQWITFGLLLVGYGAIAGFDQRGA